jgi:hypothetical protein
VTHNRRIYYERPVRRDVNFCPYRPFVARCNVPPELSCSNLSDVSRRPCPVYEEYQKTKDLKGQEDNNPELLEVKE